MASETAPRNLCCFCRLPKADLTCGLCQDDICRSCVQRLSEDTMAYASQRPEVVTHASYCPRCYDAQVVPVLEEYESVLARAKEVHYWPVSYRGQVPLLKKGRNEVVVPEGRDRSEVLLKLGFLAAEQGFNGLIRGEIVSRKVRNHGYQKMEWSGRAWPAMIDESKLERQEFRERVWGG